MVGVHNAHWRGEKSTEILVRISEGEVRTRCWENGIKISLKEVGCENVTLSSAAQYSDQWMTFKHSNGALGPLNVG
jgi:hypothetical protein